MILFEQSNLIDTGLPAPGLASTRIPFSLSSCMSDEPWEQFAKKESILVLVTGLRQYASKKLLLVYMPYPHVHNLLIFSGKHINCEIETLWAVFKNVKIWCRFTQLGDCCSQVWHSYKVPTLKHSTSVMHRNDQGMVTKLWWNMTYLRKCRFEL